MKDGERDENGASEFEELGDEVIIAQETAAHAPQPRAQVTTDAPTIVISEPPAVPRKISTVPPLRRPERTEKTVVIRDRKRLDRIRREAARHARKRGAPRARTLYLLALAVLASLVAGTLLAALTSPSESERPPPTQASSEVEFPAAPPPVTQEVPEVVDLEDLPVVKSKKKKKSNDD